MVMEETLRLKTKVLTVFCVLVAYQTFLTCRYVDALRQRDAAIQVAKRAVREYVGCQHTVKYE